MEVGPVALNTPVLSDGRVRVVKFRHHLFALSNYFLVPFPPIGGRGEKCCAPPSPRLLRGPFTPIFGPGDSPVVFIGRLG